jgi:hypothetical protein
MINKVYDYIFDDNPLKALEIVKLLHLDKIEELYNRILKEYQNRNGGA